MSITRAELASVEALATWMQTNCVPGIFKAVTYSDSVLTATDADDNAVLKINGGTGAGSSAYVRAYRTASSYIGLAGNRLPSSGKLSVIGCDNGFILGGKMSDTSGYERDFAMLVSVTNNGKPAIVFPSALSSTANAQYKTSLNHVSFGDSATISSTTTFTPESGQQTIMTTFGTNADITAVSYTPKAFYMPVHSAYSSGIGKFLCGGKVYITNGYWCIDTEQTQEEET